MYELCTVAGSVIGSFPAWTPVKGPLRKIRYEWVRRCPIFDYSESGVRRLFEDAGFARTEISTRRSGFLARAWR
jgi:hypothetical protein